MRNREIVREISEVGLCCSLQWPRATCGHLNLNEFTINKIKIQFLSCTIAIFQVFSDCHMAQCDARYFLSPQEVLLDGAAFDKCGAPF